jgi:hypothetical protein
VIEMQIIFIFKITKINEVTKVIHYKNRQAFISDNIHVSMKFKTLIIFQFILLLNKKS